MHLRSVILSSVVTAAAILGYSSLVGAPTTHFVQAKFGSANDVDPAVAADTSGAKPTVILLVRHAEKALDEGDDPSLTAAGTSRANALAHVAREAGVSTLYSTTYQRTRLTAEPLANALGLSVQTLPAKDTEGLVKKLRTEHAGETVLVSGHSNTVPAVLRALGADYEDLDERDYDNLFVAYLSPNGEVTVTLLQFGEATPLDDQG